MSHNVLKALIGSWRFRVRP